MKISFYGDSTAYGATMDSYGNVTQSIYNEPYLLNTMLQERFGPSVTVDNKGIGGTTSPQWLWGQGPVSRSWSDEMCSSNADIVIINTGINDAFIPGFSLQDFIYCYNQFIIQAKAEGKRIAIASPNPINNSHNSMLWEYQHNQSAISANHEVPFISQYLAISKNVPAWQTFLPDNIHPNDELYRFKAGVSYMTLSAMVSGEI